MYELDLLKLHISIHLWNFLHRCKIGCIFIYHLWLVKDIPVIMFRNGTLNCATSAKDDNELCDIEDRLLKQMRV